MPKKIAILGSTGSIGFSTLKVIQKLKPAFTVCALTARSNIQDLARQIRAFRPKVAAVMDEGLVPALRGMVKGLPTRVVGGKEGLVEAAAHSGADMVLSAIVGGAGLEPTFAAIRKGLDVALANKETLVMAGDVMTAAAKKSGSRILPVDSEHCAVFQCLAGNGNPSEIHRIILTASGGPFRELPKRDFAKVTVKDALKHPTWRMGPKITIDSATLMNKGLEVIEAHYLFAVPFPKIDIVVHPESIVHSMVEYMDGSVLAQLGTTDMQIPIQYALTWPRRAPSPVKRLDLTSLSGLHFYRPDLGKFPCVELAYEAGKRGGGSPAVLNAANEVAVARFLAGKLKFTRIAEVIGRVTRKFRPMTNPTLAGILDADRWARAQAAEI